MSTEPSYVVMVVMGAPELTEAAIGDVLAQSVPVRLLIVNQGVDDAFRARLETIAEQYSDQILCWHHDPRLPSLSATWNHALQFVWESGGTEALVVNNDVRIRPQTYDLLQVVLRFPKRGNLFVSAVGVTAEQYHPDIRLHLIPEDTDPERATIPELHAVFDAMPKGGPDFSCFMISREGHERYAFDENFIPSFTEDLDMHRRYLLGGDGDKIFSINLPYWHVGGGSNTLKSMTPEARAAHERRISAGSRAYYEKKWGGPVNHERYTIPFDPSSAQDGVTTPELQAACTSPQASSPTIS